MKSNEIRNYNKISFRQSMGNENDAYVANVIQTRPNGQMQSININSDAKKISTPSMAYKQTAEFTSATDCSTMAKDIANPIRIKRSSSKKNRDKKSTFFGSADVNEDGKNRSLRLNDSKDEKLHDMRNTEDVNKKKATKQDFNEVQTHSKYQHLSSKIDQSKQYDSAMWDKRFVDFNSKARAFDLLPAPDANYLKKILDTEKDER